MKTTLFICLILGLITGCEASEGRNPAAIKASEPKAPLSVGTVRAADLRARDFIEVTGLLFPAQDVTVMAGVPGDVARIEANEGDFVKKGEPLAVLDQSEYRITLRQAEHQSEAARLALRQLELDYQRNLTLHETGSITDSQLEQLALKLDLARSQWKIAKDGEAMARKKLGDTVIRAPFDCYVTHRLVSVGSRITVMPPTALFRVIDLSNLDFKMQVPDIHFSRVRRGDRVVIWFGALAREIEAKVDEVVGSVDPRSMTFTAIVRLDNRALDHALMPGTMGHAKIYVQGIENTYLLEKKLFRSLELAKNRGVVFAFENGLAKARAVTIEELDDLRVRVTKGLSDDDVIIVSAIEDLEDGQTISATP